MNKIGIIDTGKISNLFSIKNAVQFLGFEAIIIKKPIQFKDVSKIIIPGVGTYPMGVKNLKKNKLFKFIKLYKKNYVLGICLGMQIMSKRGFEFKKTNGLGILTGEVKRIDNLSELPNVGFKNVFFDKKDKIFKGIKQNSEFYFTHSFELKKGLPKEVLAKVNFKNKSIVAVTKKNNFYGVQFHPEKSGKIGLQLLNNFLNLK